MRFTAAVLVTLLAALPAVADTQKDKRDCANRRLGTDEQIAACTRVIDAQELTKEEHAWALNERGWIYQRNERYDEAIADFNRSLELDPGNPEVIENRGIAYFNSDQDAKAVEDFRRVTELRPREWYGWYLLGRAFAAERMRDEALAAYNKALGLNPRKMEAYRGRARIYLGQEKYDLATQEAAAMIELSPYEADAYHIRGTAQDMRDEDAAALHDYVVANSLNPNLAGLKEKIAALAPEAPVPAGKRVPVPFVPPPAGRTMTFLSTERPKAANAEADEIVGELLGWFVERRLPMPTRRRFEVRTVDSVDGGTVILEMAALLPTDSLNIPEGVKPATYKSMWTLQMPGPGQKMLEVEQDRDAIDSLYPLEPGKTATVVADLIFVCPDEIGPMENFLGCNEPGQRLSLGKITSHVTVGEWERVLVPAGQFDAIVVTANMTAELDVLGRKQEHKAILTQWYVPELGFWAKRTRELDESVIWEELMSVK